RIRSQIVHAQSGRTKRPFVASAAPAAFAQHGYMSEDNTGRVFNAPDADVLLDESFATTHCFHLQASDATHSDQIGLAFTPVPDHYRDTLVDVNGVIWMDNTTPQLRSLDFLYTALEPAATDIRSGGHLEFRTMPNGVAFIERWHLRLAIMTQLPRPMATIRRGVVVDDIRPERRQTRYNMRVVDVAEAGGVVHDA